MTFRRVSVTPVWLERDGSDLWRQDDDQGTDVLSAQLGHTLIAYPQVDLSIL